MKLVLALLTVVAIAGCSASKQESPTVNRSPSTGAAPTSPSTATQTPTASPTQPAQPRTAAAAKTLAKEEVARWNANDIAGAWELWTATGQKTISKADYVRLTHGCHPDGPIPIKVSNVRLETSTHAIARIGLGVFQSAYDIVYESGQWRWRPVKADMADYKLGWKKALARAKSKGYCD